MQAFLTTISDKVGFHTHPLPTQRNLKIVIKRLPYDITNEEITEELTGFGYKPTFIRAFAKNGKRIPIHMVSLDKIETAKNIYQLQHLFYIYFSIEAYKSTGPTQCFRCQGFGHSSNHCGHNPRCIKCGENHPTQTCPKPRDIAAKCCNCGGEHTANYRGCPFYANLLHEKDLQRGEEKVKTANITIQPKPNPIPFLPNQPN